MGVPPVARTTTRSRDPRVAAVAVAVAAVAAAPALIGAREPERDAAPRSARPDVRGATEGFPVALVPRGEAVPLRLRPLGRVVGRLRAHTEFGSAQRLAIVRRLGTRWLGVTTAALPNGRLAWIPADRVYLRRVREAIEIDLSRRELHVLRGGRVLRAIPVAIGRRGSPTPTGRFHVTDKLAGPHYGPAYGCCILALSGRQPQLPAGWDGGDRLAIHGTARPGLIGRAVSAGCLHARRADLSYLMRTIRLGTPVFIRP